jgi:hypothetical protein
MKSGNINNNCNIVNNYVYVTENKRLLYHEQLNVSTRAVNAATAAAKAVRTVLMKAL